MAANLPGQSARLCGQASQVASCGSHSAGMRQPRSAGAVGMVVRPGQGTPGPAGVRVPGCAPCELRYDTERRLCRVSPPRARPPSASTPGEVAMVAGKTVLLVDDDPDILGAMQTIFT